MNIQIVGRVMGCMIGQIITLAGNFVIQDLQLNQFPCNHGW